MCGHLENVSLRAASLYIKTLSAVVLSITILGSRPFNRSLIAEAIGNAGMCLLCFFKSITKFEHTSFSAPCDSSKHIVFH